MREKPAAIAPARLDRESRRWLEQLRGDGPRRDCAVARLRDVLLRAAAHELARRRAQLGLVSGPEFDDLAEQAADDALMLILDRLDEFEGRSRFTTWAYKFVMFEVSNKVARHAWQRHAPGRQEPVLDHLPDALAPQPGDRLERREQLAALAAGIAALTERQRDTFVAIALNEEPIDVVALRLGSTRGAIYKNLFDARRSLRERLARAGHPVGEDSA